MVTEFPENISINDKSPVGLTPLRLAVMIVPSINADESWSPVTEMYFITKLLLENNADPNAQDHNQRVPLHYAACLGSDLITGLLIDYGADIDIQDERGFAALHYAIFNEDRTSRVIEQLLQRGASLHTADIIYQTPLHYANSRIRLTSMLDAYGQSFSQRILRRIHTPRYLSP
ncbi:ankyrin repeat-containing domain protein [Hypoxylon sp. FL1284]|nr:ankyrin repeat-containing domain protein [Hypoxylon sp. FL1284]